ncbi:Hpt domain-containing protein [Desulfovibrio gilichinskyi]|uniref:Hpt domain-containing protein n=1 Tax=Desulfovibrio gilichinskyi TaxID=1519643 RepID=A0A1X7DHJ5_9BACT|nr:Hpt domain-containing protein [Desulfovibrio gilichinskyi]SMF15557.1 Hpt domain-containing protein [Desulfovibrio gilichinskyi]
MSNELFNEQAFFDHLGGDRELGAEILGVYLTDAPARMGSLLEAAKTNNLSLVIKYSHALKGISATIRAEKVADVAEAVELAARHDHLEKVKEFLPDIARELESTLKVLKDYLGI